MDKPANTTSKPHWWNDTHGGAWERVKEAFARDWEQTKADFSKKHGQELKQNAGDTIKQAAGKEPVPPPAVPNAKPDDYATAEPALRYGYGASSHYADHREWGAEVEAKLKKEWDDLKSGRDWESVKSYVRHGWDKARSGHKS